MSHARTRISCTAPARLRLAVLLSTSATLAGFATAQPVAAVASAPGGASLGEMRAEVVRLTNNARGHCERDLRINTKLNRSAQGHADDMSDKNYFSHTSRSGRSWDSRIRAAGFTQPGGENIAYGYRSAERVVDEWLDSPAHRRNIKDCDFDWIGVGYNPDGGFWVQDFGY